MGKKDIEELQEILEDNDIGEIAASGEASKAWEEAKEKMLENVEESSALDETLPSSARLEPVEPAMQTQEKAKEEVGEVKEGGDDKQCSLEKEEEEEKPKAMDNGELAEFRRGGFGEGGGGELQRGEAGGGPWPQKGVRAGEWG